MDAIGLGEGGKVQQQTGEPSVEEILQSIRKVVGERGGGDPRRSAAGDKASGPGEPGDAVLELTDVLDQAPPGDADNGDDPPLLAPERQAAVRESLQAFAALAAPGASEGIVRSAEASLDGLTRELLRPMMADWLDRNLPPLVEKLLKAEIARLTRRPE